MKQKCQRSGIKKISQKGLSIILTLALLSGVLVGNVKKAQANELSSQVLMDKQINSKQNAHYLQPYQTTNMMCYTGNSTKSFKMMGNEYFYGVVPENWADFKQVLYNLDGQFQTVTLDVGHWDGCNDANATMYIYMDNQLVQQIILSSDMVNQTLSLSTDNVKQLKFEISKYGAFYGLGNVIGYGGHNLRNEIVKVPTPIESGICKYTCTDCDYSYEEIISASDTCTPYLTPYQTTNLISYELTEDQTDYFCVMGKRYYKGMVPKNWGDKKEALYNLGKKYKSVSFYVGHWDNNSGSGNDAKLYAYLDGVMVKEIPLSNDMISQKITINTENISQLKLVYECYGAFFAIYDMEYIATIPMSHEFNQKEILAPTWDSDGIIMYTCKNCNMSYTKTISYDGKKPDAKSTSKETKKTNTTTEKTKKLKLSSVKCKTKSRKITGKVSVSKATVKIKIGKKKYRKAILKGKKFTLRINTKLRKGTKVTIKVTKKNYKKLTKTYVVK